MNKTSNMKPYILEQPEILQKIISGHDHMTESFVDAFRKTVFSNLCLVASGSSKNAAYCAAPFMEKLLHLPVTVTAPSRFDSALGANPLLVFISQGGNSNNMIRAFSRNPETPSIVLTGDQNGRLWNLAENPVLIPCGEELAGPKTKGYTSTILMLYFMALDATFAFRSMQTVFLIGCGVVGEVAKEGALKLMETILLPSCSFDFEEFQHGPCCCLDSKVSALYFLPEKSTPEFVPMQSLVRNHRSFSTTVFRIGTVPGEDVRDLCLKTSGKWYTLPFEYTLVPQVIANDMTPLYGFTSEGSKRFAYYDRLLQIRHH